MYEEEKKADQSVDLFHSAVENQNFEAPKSPRNMNKQVEHALMNIENREENEPNNALNQSIVSQVDDPNFHVSIPKTLQVEEVSEPAAE